MREYPEFPSQEGWASIAAIQAGEYDNRQVKLRGWIYRTRSSGSIAFVVVRDTSGILQCTVKKGQVPEEDLEGAKKALLESSVVVEGTVAEDRRAPGGHELKATSFEVLHYADPYPITKDQSDEWLMDNRHLWIRSQDMNAALRLRATLFGAFREFWDGKGYTEVHSPSFVRDACEGGSTLFNIYVNDDDKPSMSKPDPGDPTDGQRFYAHLTQSWQLYAEAMMFSVEKIYTIAPSFRAEKSRTRRHVSEFWHAEVEAAWTHNEQMMVLDEEMLIFLVERILERHEPLLKQLGRDVAPLKAIEGPFERMKYQEVLDELNGMGFDLAWGDDFGYIEEKALTEKRSSPLYITHFPKEKGFYHRPDPAEPEALVCHDLLAPEGYGEIIGGGERVWDPDQLMQRIEEEHLDPESLGWYLDLRKFGSVPHAGFGLGLDRLLTWLTGQEHIKHVIPFPRSMRRTRP